jgi:hypothetical protein
MTLSPTQDDSLKVVSKVIAEILVAFGFICLRSWLLSICVGWIFPGFILGFWQWVLIVITIRMLIWPTNYNNK